MLKSSMRLYRDNQALSILSFMRYKHIEVGYNIVQEKVVKDKIIQTRHVS